jgi:hypothetical protein
MKKKPSVEAIRCKMRKTRGINYDFRGLFLQIVFKCNHFQCISEYNFSHVQGSDEPG